MTKKEKKTEIKLHPLFSCSGFPFSGDFAMTMPPLPRLSTHEMEVNDGQEVPAGGGYKVMYSFLPSLTGSFATSASLTPYKPHTSATLDKKPEGLESVATLSTTAPWTFPCRLSGNA